MPPNLWLTELTRDIAARKVMWAGPAPSGLRGAVSLALMGTPGCEADRPARGGAASGTREVVPLQVRGVQEVSRLADRLLRPRRRAAQGAGLARVVPGPPLNQPNGC